MSGISIFCLDFILGYYFAVFIKERKEIKPCVTYATSAASSS